MTYLFQQLRNIPLEGHALVDIRLHRGIDPAAGKDARVVAVGGTNFGPEHRIPAPGILEQGRPPAKQILRIRVFRRDALPYEKEPARAQYWSVPII